MPNPKPRTLDPMTTQNPMICGTTGIKAACGEEGGHMSGTKEVRVKERNADLPVDLFHPKPKLASDPTKNYTFWLLLGFW